MYVSVRQEEKEKKKRKGNKKNYIKKVSDKNRERKKVKANGIKTLRKQTKHHQDLPELQTQQNHILHYRQYYLSFVQSQADLSPFHSVRPCPGKITKHYNLHKSFQMEHWEI